MRRSIVKTVVEDVIDSIALLTPNIGLTQEQRQLAFDRAIIGVDVMEWFNIDTTPFVESLQVCFISTLTHPLRVYNIEKSMFIKNRIQR